MHSWEEKKILSEDCRSNFYPFFRISNHIFKIPQLENISKYAFEMFTKQM